MQMKWGGVVRCELAVKGWLVLLELKTPQSDGVRDDLFDNDGRSTVLVRLGASAGQAARQFHSFNCLQAGRGLNILDPGDASHHHSGQVPKAYAST
jgi:hypothetical protein